MNENPVPEQRAESLQKLITMGDLLELLGITRPSVNRLISTGELPVVRIGTRLRFEQADVAALIARGCSLQTPCESTPGV